MLARQTVNVNQREKDLNILDFSFFHNLHVNQGVKLTLQTDWNRTLMKPGILWIVPVLARLTCKNSFIIWAARESSQITYSLSYLCQRKPNFAKKLFRKLSLDNLCKRPLISVKERCDSLISSAISFLSISFLKIKKFILLLNS